MQQLISSVIQGFPIGCVFALVAVGFVLTYKVSGVFNLAFGAQAYAAAAAYYELRVDHGWPTPPAAVVAVFVVSPLIGLVLYYAIYRHLRSAPPVARLAVSIGLLVALPEIVNVVLRFGNSPQYGVEGVVGNGDTTYHFSSYVIDRNQLATIIVTLALVAGLTLMFRYTTIGLRMRAVVESARMTELAGISADRVSSVGWALSSILAGMAGVLLGPLFPQLSSQNFFLLIVAAIAAAAFAGLSSLPLALAGGLSLGIGAQILSRTLPTNSILAQGLRPSLPFVALFLVLILKPSLKRKKEFTDPLSGVDPPPPALAAVERGPGLTRATYAFETAVCVGLVGWFVFVGNAYWLSLATQAVIFAIIFLSITVFTGMAGEISLAQGSFAAIGAFTCGQLATRFGMSVFVGLAAGIALAAAVGVLLAIPALRLGGIYLALATLAFGLFFEEVIVKFDWAGGGILPVTVPRPILGPVNFTSDRAFFFLCLFALVLTALFVVRMRRGTTGLSLRALAGSEVAGSSVGLSPTRARITAFAVCAGIAAAGGALLSMREGAANYQADFTVPFALFWLVIVVTLGSRSVEGAIVGAFALEFFPELLNGLGLSPSWQYILFGLGAIAFAAPSGGNARALQADIAELHPASARPLSGARRAPAFGPVAGFRRRPGGRDRTVDGRAMTGGEPLLAAEHVTVRFAGITALADVSLTVGEREVVGLIGPNGAGKTTMFNCLFGALRPNEGVVRFGGASLGALPMHKRARLGLGRTFQRIELFAGMTVREHLLVAERARRRDGALWKDLLGLGSGGADEKARVDTTLELLGLVPDADRPIEALSLGRGRLVEVGRALMTEPRLLLLDEPSSGLDRDETRALTETLRVVHEERGIAMLLVEHDVDMVLDLVERIYVLDFGTLIAAGPAHAVLSDAKVRAAYLGETAPPSVPAPAETS